MKELLLGVLLGAGLNLLNSLRDQLPDNLDDIKTRVRDTYGTASDRVSRASDVLRGEEDLHILGKVGALLIGVGVGVGVGLLIAPARGEETRADIAEKVSDFGDTSFSRRHVWHWPGHLAPKALQTLPAHEAKTHIWNSVN